MKNFLMAAIGLVIIGSIVFIFGMSMQPEKAEPEKQEASQQTEEPYANAKEYLEDPDSYMEELDEKYKPELEDDHHAEEKPDDYYQNQKNELLKMDTIILTNENYTSVLDVLDRFPKEFEGKQIELTGFVHREKDFKQTQFVVARSGDPCCKDEHDGLYGLFSAAENAADFKDRQWVSVTGELQTTMYSSTEIPYLQIKEISKIDPPSQPYVYEEKEEAHSH
ncbi:TIGR03943 family putative permease subunit [Metabacillus indicus]|uniref:TIGR03943 family putative permease subunit n=1 Tax=Metabacillus indicus TaxID=246786 RepID=UPI0024935112|nr:TIGR03943 family protein [Metabacillus indicus]